ncbi:DUF602-domain-containing protein [Durotheca rogersii]|uniref:DUF602-domain-containing protein n=1 Tax=Durotheca rogersii TaxID=419775 RepID=UPI002220FA84|nr:DUF602-domain-containing protein [Durotheca rogersii]KAI5860911.1 DUF602-domain-containing protein [Durotheca rogersii]
MGNDGGSIPKRRELVREAARLPTTSELKATALESLSHAWAMCPLSDAPLDPANTASDWRGRLYSYEAILQCLIPPSSTEPARPEAQQAEFARTGVKTLKDVVKLRFALRSDEKGREARACPISLKELGAATRSVYVVPCGHVFAEAAMKELEVAGPETERQCPECSATFVERDVIPILPTDEAEVDKLAKRIDELKALGLTHSLKKDKGSGKKKRKAEEKEKGTNEDARREPDGSRTEKKASKNGISSRINNPMTASLTAKVLAEQEERTKRRKIIEGHRRGEPVR